MLERLTRSEADRQLLAAILQWIKNLGRSLRRTAERFNMRR